MKGLRKGSSVLAAVAVLLSAIVAVPIGKVNAAIPGVDSTIDPTVNPSNTLPEELDQAMGNDGMPNGVFMIGESSYSFGVATGTDGTVYYADYSGVIRKKSPDKLGYVSLLSSETRINTGVSGLFNILIDADNNIVYAKDGDSNNGSVGIYNQTTGAKTVIIPSLTRPRQMAMDASGNIYVACEDGAIKKWDKATGAVTVVAPNLFGAQGLAIMPDGTLYVLCYSKHSDSPLVGVSYVGGRLYQINDGKAVTVAGGDTQYFWRSRGLTVDDKGYLYLISESNAWDNGNSSLFARFNPGQRSVQNVMAGLDFATYSAYGKDGRFYMPLARDDYLVAYSEKAAAAFAEQNWSSQDADIRVSTYGGSFVPSASGNATLEIGSLTLTGTVATKAGADKVYGWVKVPADKLPEISKEVVPGAGLNSGKHPLPEVSLTTATGESATAIMLLRVHQKARWPMQDIHTPNANFSEAPEAYMIYFEWTPHNLSSYEPPAGAVYDEFINDALEPADPPYVDSDSAAFDFSNSEANVTKAGDVHIIDFNGSNAYTLCTGSNLAFKFRMSEGTSYDWLGLALDNGGPAGLGSGSGIRAILWRSAYNTTIRVVETAVGKGWDAVAGTQQIIDGKIVDEDGANDGKGLGDGNWHTFEIKEDNGVWSILIDGEDVVRNRYDGLDMDLTRMLNGEGKTYLTFFSSSNMGGVEIEQIVREEETPLLDFSNSEANVTKAGDISIIDFNGSNAYALCTASDLAFKIRFNSDNPFDWVGMAIDNSGVSGLGNGDGLRTILWKNHYNATVRLVETEKGIGWDAAASRQFMDGKLVPDDDNANGGNGLGDGNWHTVRLKNDYGVWSMTIDDIEILRNKYSGSDADMTRLLSGQNQTYLTLFTSSNVGTVEIEAIPPEGYSGSILNFEKTEAGTSIVRAGDTTVIELHGGVAYATGTADGLEFDFRWSNPSFDWMGITFGNTLAGLGSGSGIQGLLWKAVPNATLRSVDTAGGKGWDSGQEKTVIDGPVSENPPDGYSFNDGDWHKIAIKRIQGSWSIKIDGNELLKNRYDGLDADLDEFFGDGFTITLYTSSSTGTIDIRQSAETVNKTNLLNRIESATELYESTTPGNRPGQVAQAQYDALWSAIVAAQAVADDSGATSNDVKDAIALLQQAVYDFTVAIVPPTNFTALLAKLTEAKALKSKTGVGSGTGQASEAAHSAFQIAIDAAQDVADNSEALQAEADAAVTTLDGAINTFVNSIVVAKDVLAFDFVGTTGPNFNDKRPGTVTKADKGVVLGFPDTGSIVYTLVTGTNLEFEFKINTDANFEWFGFNLSNSGHSMLGSGNGLSTIFWRAQYAITSRVVEEIPGKYWDAAGATKQIHDGGLADGEGASFSDGNWHHVELKKTESGWTFTVDGIDVIQNRYSGFDADMDRLFGGSNTVTMTLFTNGAAGEIQVFQDVQTSGLNTTALKALIETGKDLLTSSTDERIPASAKNKLQQAIDAAQAVIDNPDSVQEDVDAQKDLLSAAIVVFNEVVEGARKTHAISDDMAQIQEVTEDTLYDVLMLMDAYEKLTDAEKAMFPKSEMEKLQSLLKAAYKFLRVSGAVSVSGDKLPYYLQLVVNQYDKSDDEWDKAFGNGKLPLMLFDISFEDYLTGGAYSLKGQPATVTIELSGEMRKYSNFLVKFTAADGSVQTLSATVKDGKLVFGVTQAGQIAISGVEDSPKTGQANTLIWLAVIPMLVMVMFMFRKRLTTH